MDKTSQILHLRLEKLTEAAEAGAVDLGCILLFWWGERYFVGATRDLMILISVICGTGYTGLVMIRNLIRWIKIRKLEKEV